MADAANKEDDVEVRWEDQQRINEFGKNTNHLLELKTERNETQKQLDYLEDAEQEVLLSDDSDEHKVRMGETFIVVNEDDFNEFIESRREKLNSIFEKQSEEINALEGKQQLLKSDLYARFGKNINLDI
mmetsp:Transcript_16902/g.20854  ORF Transcript_16902/g.20854 Transcript_16902/m.20854 type:complete len:129 (+) Transcript_16902:136-522(+)|eukprot:CAMPEP_0204827942 /NCGR_PEP_ID=MMETSP1346-20131115/5489_1 /ASSEMBLY_ACC=CAM_ASM_000771 /TAXON_ID=215587 /ORGANISM="Aplanochytrium stocchinoi, Strain GSBS06" /LENGTH=128 /DNA_ID=CAMNT_0051956647 /DNA_START=50 /DNA_END=436 /DNA_ORIENTATION=-